MLHNQVRTRMKMKRAGKRKEKKITTMKWTTMMSSMITKKRITDKSLCRNARHRERKRRD